MTQVKMFDKKRPCSNCPFRKGQGSYFRLTKEKLQEIRHAVAFQCHKTINYALSADDEGYRGNNPKQCAGLMAILHREGDPNNIMRMAMAMGHLDPEKLDPDGEAYATWDDMFRAHRGCEENHDKDIAA